MLQSVIFSNRIPSVTIISIVRLQSLINYTLSSSNPTWDFFSVALWSTIEVNVGLICTCLPTFRQWLFSLFPSPLESGRRLFGSGSSGSGRKRPNQHSAGASHPYPHPESRDSLSKSATTPDEGAATDYIEDIHLVGVTGWDRQCSSEVTLSA